MGLGGWVSLSGDFPRRQSMLPTASCPPFRRERERMGQPRLFSINVLERVLGLIAREWPVCD